MVPSPPSSVSKLSLFLSLPVCRRSSLLTGEGWEEGEGAKLHAGKKAWPFIIHKLLSAPALLPPKLEEPEYT